MTVEQLLKSRFEVIADYPNSIFKVGSIINTSSDRIFCDTESEKYSDFPHLFKKLEWFEKREILDMPEYLKNDNQVFKILEWIIQGGFFFGITSHIKREGCDLFHNSAFKYMPATEEEFLSFINKA